jgi:tetratricopeptide (TPR) repeat protein
VAYDRGDIEQAIKILERCLPIWRRVGNTSGLAFGIVYYSQALLKAGLLDRAAEVLSEAERQVAAIPQRWGCAMLLLARARLHMARGDAAAGVACCHEAAPILARLGDRRGLAEAHECLAALLLASDPKQAARHLGAARKLREQAFAPLPVSEHEAVARMEKELTVLLGNEQYVQLFADANPPMDARTHRHGCS